MNLSPAELAQLKREVKLINQSYSDRLDEVGELADDEIKDVESGACDQRMVRWIRDRNPAWEDAKVLSALKKARAASKSRTRASVTNMNASALSRLCLAGCG